MKAVAARTGISPARSAAFYILLEVSRSASAHSDDLLQSARLDALSSQDCNLCTALTMGVLRWQLLLDEHIAPLLKHKSKLDIEVSVALRLAAFQLIFFDRIPTHAAISDSVELTKRSGHRFASGLVNAVLRKLALNADECSRSAQRAHPEWMLKQWASFLPEESVAAVCAWDQQPPPASVRLVAPDVEASLTAEGIQLERGHFLTASRRVASGNVADTGAVSDGLARLQDEGSQLVAELLGGQKRPLSILDCCAAPGGKTTIVAERHPDSRVVACDISAERMARMQKMFSKAPLLAQIEYRVGDATHLAAPEQFDRILCDVPCSGTGTLARNPEIKLRLRAEDLARQQERQIAILQSALRALAPGGELVYSTCSLEPEENEQVIQAVLSRESSVRILPVQSRIEQLLANDVLHKEGADLLLNRGIQGEFLRTIPGIIPTDGFFAAILTR